MNQIDTLADLALENFLKMACCFLETMALAAFTGIATLSFRLGEKRSLRPASLSRVKVWWVAPSGATLAAWDVILTQSGLPHRQYCVSRLEQISKCIVGKRPGRFEPRVRKKRGSNYNLMMQPRGELNARLATGDNSFETK